jgi:hypothetical protein
LIQNAALRSPIHPQRHLISISQAGPRKHRTRAIWLATPGFAMALRPGEGRVDTNRRRITGTSNPPLMKKFHHLGRDIGASADLVIETFACRQKAGRLTGSGVADRRLLLRLLRSTRPSRGSGLPLVEFVILVLLAADRDFVGSLFTFRPATNMQNANTAHWIVKIVSN